MSEQTTPESGVQQEPDVLERMGNFLTQFDEDQAAGNEPPQQAVAEKEPAPQSLEAEAQAEPTVEDLPEPQVDADAFEIVHNGANLKLSRADTIKYAQQGFDYDRKTQALAEDRRQLQERAKLLSTYEQMVPHLTADKAQMDAIGQELAKYQNVNWVQIAQQNPNEYPVLRAQYDQMVFAYQSAAQRLNQKQQQVFTQFSHAMAQQQAKERDQLRTRIPQWKDQDTYQKESPAIADYMLKDYGYSPHEIENLWDSRVTTAFYKAYKYDQLQRAKADKVKQLRTAPPVTRPNSPNSSQGDPERTAQLQKRLQRTGDVRDAAALLANRWK